MNQLNNIFINHNLKDAYESFKLLEITKHLKPTSETKKNPSKRFESLNSPTDSYEAYEPSKYLITTQPPLLVHILCIIQIVGNY